MKAVEPMSLLETNEENYVCPKGEEHLYHYKLEMVTFDQKTGERLSRPFVQKSGKKFFEEGGLHSLRGLGYDVVVLHNPRKWEADHEKENAKAEAKRKEAEAKAEAERKAAEKQALFEEFKAQLAEEGLEIVKATPKKK